MHCQPAFLHRPCVVYFCPTDSHPVCEGLALALRDRWLEINSQVDMVLAVTTDDLFEHREFAAEHELPLLLVADSDGKVHRLFGLTPGVVTSYLVDTDRKILRVLDTSDPAKHALSIASVLAELGKASEPYPI